MNHALFYLWRTLIQRRLGQRVRRLKRPGTLIGFVAVSALGVFLFSQRRQPFVGDLLQPGLLVMAGLVMFLGSILKGFLQRGLVFEPSETEFLFTSPFTHRQIIWYRLWSNYLFSAAQSVAVAVIFAHHLEHPIMAAGGVFLFQILCFHLSTAAAIYGGTIEEDLHYRLRWVLVGLGFLSVAFYLRVAFDFRPLPPFFGSRATQLLFYPAANLPNSAIAALQDPTLGLPKIGSGAYRVMANYSLALAALTVVALASLWQLLRLKGNLFEPALANTLRQSERRLRIEHGRTLTEAAAGTVRSFGSLPALFYGGFGGLIWKNLVAAARSLRALLPAAGFVAVYTGLSMVLLYLFQQKMAREPASAQSAYESLCFHLSIALFLAAQTLFLQRMVPFDFRRDGRHLLDFRTMPITPMALVLAELTVPTLVCLALQAPGLIMLCYCAHFPWLILALVLLAFPAVTLALNAVWNLHYLLSATRRAAGQSDPASAVGTLLMVALSFLVFYPAGWTAIRAARQLPAGAGFELPLAIGVAVQCLIDVLLVLLLVTIYRRFNVAFDRR